MKNKIKIFIPILIIISISLIGLYIYNINYFYKQLIWIILGFTILFFKDTISVKKLFKYSKYIYWFNIVLLVLVLFLGNEINGSRAWFDLKFFSLQPSEIMKLSLALYLANYFNKINANLFFSFLLFLIPSILVYLEPDTGAIIMYAFIYFPLLFWRIKSKKIIYVMLILFFLILGLGIYLYIYEIDFLIKILGTSIFYRIDRIINFRNNYQLENALISIGSSSWVGSDLPRIYIPECSTDFMFAYVVSNLGYITGFIILGCYLLLNIFIINSIKEKTKMGYFTLAFISLFLFQQAQNILMNIGLIPIMGIPLHFLSYGGSNTIIYFVFLAILLNKKRI